MNTDTPTTEKATSEPVNRYTLNDVGCYVDGARGIYAIDAIAEFAISHGWNPPEDSEDIKEFSDELEDDCDNWMNEHYGVDGAYWGRSEQGDWGLWAIEED